MRVKAFVLTLLFLFISYLFTPKVLADQKASGSSATFQEILQVRVRDPRAKILQRYLDQYDSPLAQYSDVFVAQADFYKIDWRLVAAISGVESTFGKAEPANCYNGWGYGIYGNNMLCFTSYNDAIHTISKSLREQYMDIWGATDVYSIGHIYAASPTWAAHVTYFMNDIENFSEQTGNQPLSISL